MIQSQIAARIDAFTTELHALVRRAALEAVSAALGGAAATRAPAGRPAAAPRRRGRPPKSSGPAAPATPAAASAAKLPTKPRKGGKRSPEQLAKIDAAVQSFVKVNPGKGVEHMAASLGVPSGDIKSRVALLIDAKKLKKTGVKRATKYFAS